MFLFVSPDERSKQLEKEPTEPMVAQSNEIDGDRCKSSNNEAKESMGRIQEVDRHGHDDHPKMERLTLQFVPHRLGFEVIVRRRAHGTSNVADRTRDDTGFSHLAPAE